MRGNSCILGGLESSAAVVVCSLPCFPVSQAGLHGCGGQRVVGNTVALLACSVWSKGEVPRPLGKLPLQGSQDYLPCSPPPLSLPPLFAMTGFFSTEPHKANRFQVKSELVSVFVWLLTSVHPPAGLSFHICGLPHLCGVW